MGKNRILDLFAGAGGISLGLEMFRNEAGEHVFELYRAVEIDRYACQTLRKNFGEDKVIEGDITDGGIHRRIIRECKGKVSIIVGGIPCQSFSLIGPRSGFGRKMKKFRDDKRDRLYEEFMKIVGELKPNIVMIENVKGILSKRDSGGEKIIAKVVTRLEHLGYNLEDENGNKHMVLNAADYGVPQRRERVVLIGIKKSWKNVKMPFIAPTHYDPRKSGSGEHNGLAPYVTVYEAIGDLPEVRPKITFTGIPGPEKAEITKINSTMDSGGDVVSVNGEKFHQHVERISMSGKRFFEFVRPNGYKYIDHHVARSQQKSDIELFGSLMEGETAGEFMKRNPQLAKSLIKYDMSTFRDKYRRQKSNEPCTTVFAHLQKDGNRFIHPWQTRTFTPREAARIQSFPDDFIFEGPMIKKFWQIGNAVPPLMALNMGKSVYEISRGMA